ncbi:hypothetical protein BH11ARM2_BH11ARM2_22490 [soil metagenome]
MQSEQVRREIKELEAIHRESKWWHIGGTVATLAIVAVCANLLYKSVNGLVSSGKDQDQFVAELKTSLDKDIVPRMQQVASQTITEMQPVVMKEFQGLNSRVPELTQATLDQVQKLQTSIPERSSKVLDETFGKALKDQEPEIRKMFPNVTDEQVKSLMDNLGQMAMKRGSDVANEILLPHTHRIQSIVDNLHKIEATEPKTPNDETADWHMGIIVFDLVRGDLKGLEPKLATNPQTKMTNKGAAK